MAFIEIVALLVVASVLITVFTSVGRPVAELLAEKARFKYKGLDSEAEQRLTARIEALEEELRQTKKQFDSVKEAAEFAVKMVEDKSHESIAIESKELEERKS
ncbi:MAG: hypothetical protein K2X81_06815 [Candidatus Obscuribacterales bacterium]|nr:hypothetical protein [Candidatus Obscuribacterales bacterium]